MKQKIETILLCLCCLMLLSFVSSFAYAEDTTSTIVTTVGEVTVPGNGTIANPYLISTEEQLLLISDGTLPNALSARYRLQNDITVTADSWKPIGSDNNAPFAGSFYGNGYTISGIVVNSGYSYSGFFGVNNGYINGLRVDVTINSGGCSGGLAGRNNGTILDCFSSGTVTSTGYTVGGFVGLNYSGNISCSGSSATVSGNVDVGGFVGEYHSFYSDVNSLIHDCYAQGNVTGNSCVGGFIGWIHESHGRPAVVRDCYASGVVNGGQGCGLLASDGGKVFNSYYNSYNGGNRRGFGVTLEEMKDQSTFYLWDFNDYWAMKEDGYPYISYVSDDLEGDEFLEGAGTKENPYLIKNEVDFQKLTWGTSTEQTYYFRLENDIELTAKHWMPIGTYSEFRGVLDGNGHTVSGLKHSSSDYGSIGLFGYNSGTIKNLTVIGDISGTSQMGLLAGQNNGLITNCFSHGSVSTTANNAGGLVGLNYSGNISYSGSTASVKGNYDVGGLVGNYYAYFYDVSTMIHDCYAQGDVTGTGTIGGLIGWIHNYGGMAKLRNCYASGTANSGSGGGLVSSNDGRYYNCYYYNGNTLNKRGFGVSSEALKNQNTFYQWDFENVWDMKNGYPEINLRGEVLPVTYEGTGAETSPYLIKTERQLQALATEEAKTGAGIYYQLANDITLTADFWTPIGFYDEFQSIFDGNGYTISGLKYSGNYGCAGLFAYNSGTIKNLTVIGDVTATSMAGLLAGQNNNRIENCFSHGTVTSTGNNVGGLVGVNYSANVYYCGSDATVSGNANVGGLIGEYHSWYSDVYHKVHNCYAQGDVTANSNAGGLIGNIYESNGVPPIVKNCYATGVVNDGAGGGLFGTVGGDYYNSYYYKGNTLNQRGFGVLTEEMKNKDLFYQWDFENIWTIDAGGYPYINIRGEEKTVTFEGTGSRDVPYLVETEEQLHALAMGNARIGDGIYYQLANDITLTAQHWTPIGVINNFTGVFDGNGYTISNVKHASSSYANVGLFGKNSGTIQNLTVIGNINSFHQAGLLAGSNYGLIENCYTEGSVTSTGTNVGGLSGVNEGGKIRTSGSIADVSGYDNVGGLVGYTRCYYSDTEITNCFALGTVTGNNSVGGLLGYHSQYYGTFLLRYNYAAGQVTGNSKARGFLGGYSYEGTATMCDNYYDTENSGCTDTIGATPKTTAEMKSSETYADWDFDTVWAISPKMLNGYPYLQDVLPQQEDSVTVSGISFTVTLNGNTKTGTVYAVMYNQDGTVKQIKDYPAAKEVKVVFDFGVTGAYVKVLWWNDLKPMCGAQTIPLQSSEQ